ncbi:MFS transporter small subunit [Oryzihumus sp.]|uniref:MFS transporter small subunit n=1 Tax=Oryzihumus sp. TaxID=1968903 RepID=UPI002ED86A69
MSIESQTRRATHEPERGTPVAAVLGAWLVVATPLAYGLWQTLVKAAKLFTG